MDVLVSFMESTVQEKKLVSRVLSHRAISPIRLQNPLSRNAASMNSSLVKNGFQLQTFGHLFAVAISVTNKSGRHIEEGIFF